MENVNNKNISKTLNCISFVFILLGMCLYFNDISYTAGFIRGYFLIGFVLLFFTLGYDISCYKYEGYKKYTKDYLLKFAYYAAAYLLSAIIIIIITVYTGPKTNYGFFKNAYNAYFDIPYIFKNFWFVPVYAIIILLVPVFNKIIKKSNYSPIIYFSILLIFVLNEVVAPLFPSLAHIRDMFESMRYVFFYGFITLLGHAQDHLLKNHEKNKIINLLIIISSFAFIFICIFIYGYSYDLSEQFNPPNIHVATYAILLLSVIYYFSPSIVKFFKFLENKKLIEYMSKFSYPIIILSPVILYLLTIFYNAVKLKNIFAQYYIAGFLLYLTASLIILSIIYLIVYIVKKIQKNKDISDL